MKQSVYLIHHEMIEESVLSVSRRETIVIRRRKMSIIISMRMFSSLVITSFPSSLTGIRWWMSLIKDGEKVCFNWFQYFCLIRFPCEIGCSSSVPCLLQPRSPILSFMFHQNRREEKSQCPINQSLSDVLPSICTSDRLALTEHYALPCCAIDWKMEAEGISSQRRRHDTHLSMDVPFFPLIIHFVWCNYNIVFRTISHSLVVIYIQCDPGFCCSELKTTIIPTVCTACFLILSLSFSKKSGRQYASQRRRDQANDFTDTPSLTNFLGSILYRPREAKGIVPE